MNTIDPVLHPLDQPAEANRTQVRALAQQFESMLISQMLREMRDAMAPESDDEGFGGSILSDTVNTELAQALGRSGGLGLADQLMQALERLGPADGQSDVEATAPAALPLLFEPVTPRLFEPAVTSDFGWRTDPIHGQPRFHAGQDLKLAYGEEVRAASAGVVTFAGDRQGYGLTVVVAHADGLETRYAHLSATEVKTGDRVALGQPIARSGNSGRTTGAHLHFEVRQHGQPIDPDRVSGFSPVAGLPRSAAD